LIQSRQVVGNGSVLKTRLMSLGFEHPPAEAVSNTTTASV